MSQQQQDYDMDRQHVSRGVYSERTPTTTGSRVDLLTNLSPPPGGNQTSYATLQATTTVGPSGEYQALSSFQQDVYRHESMPSMTASMPRYTESIQPASEPQHYQIGLYSYSPAPSYSEMSGNVHSNPGTSSGHNQATAHRYSISTDPYAPNSQSAPISEAYKQATPGVASVSPLDDTRLTDSLVVNYRQSMTSYHRRESESLQRRQRPQALRHHMLHNGHASEHMQAYSIYSQRSPILGGIDSRRSSVIPDIYPDERAQHGQQQHFTPQEYDIAADAQSAKQYSSSGDNNNLATSGDLQDRPADASDLMQFSGGLYSTSHASSSIPMSNSHPRHLYAGDVSDARPQQQQYQRRNDVHALSPNGKRQEGQHQSRMTHLKQTRQSERQQLHLHEQHHYQRPYSPNPDASTNMHHLTQIESPYQSRPDDPSHSSRLEHTHLVPHVRTLDRPHSNPRAQSTADPATSNEMLRPSRSSLSQSISPLSTPNDESGSESNIHDDSERSGERAKRNANGGEDAFLRRHSHDSGGTVIDQEEAQDDGVGGLGRDGGQRDNQSQPPKKRKKSKMHECEVCQKKFPRPSGLKTHMNTHSNEKPFPCGFPGCTRTFGVRSNAKRHLRTHGIIPSSATSTVTETPYMVDFSTPLIMPPHPSNVLNAGPGAAATGSGGGGSNASGPGTSDESMLNNAGDSTDDLSEGHKRDRGKSARSAFKLRWMPLSLSSRTNAIALRSAQDADMSQKMDRHDWTLEGGQVSAELRQGREDGGPEMEPGSWRMEPEDEAGDTDMSSDDAVMAARLTIPLQPVMPMHASPSPVGDSSDAGMSQSNIGLSLMGPNDPSICVCKPPCPQTSDGLVRCRNVGALSFDALSPSNAPTPPPSSAPPGSAAPGGKNTNFYEERNSYLPAGSHPYHPSQRHTPKP